jgi:hypothetical protein
MEEFAMSKEKSVVRSMTRWLLSLAVVGGTFLFTGAPRAHAETVEACQRRIAHADHELHEAIERHGQNSRQADHERHELHEARERCWREHHRWWDEHEHRWREEHDWDDRDHDR